MDVSQRNFKNHSVFFFVVVVVSFSSAPLPLGAQQQQYHHWIRWKGVVRPVFYLLNNSNFSPDGVVLSGGIVSSLPPDRPPPSFLHSLVHWASLPLQAHCRCRWQHIFAAVFPLLQREKNANTGVIGGQVGNTRTYRQHYIIMYSHFILSYFHSIREEKNSISLLDLKFQRQRNMYMHAKLRSHLCTV